jgi:hypothetical protein
MLNSRFASFAIFILASFLASANQETEGRWMILIYKSSDFLTLENMQACLPFSHV